MSDNKKQWLFFGSIVVVGLIAVFVGVLSNQAAAHQAMYLAGKVGEGLYWVLGLAIFLVIWIIILTGSGFIGYYLHKLIKSLDGNIVYDLDIPNWGHWVIVTLFSAVFFFIWIWLVPFLVSLPTWVNILYVSAGWLSSLKEMPLWWGVWGMICFAIGYGSASE